MKPLREIDRLDWHDPRNLAGWLGIGFFCSLFWWLMGMILASPLPGWALEVLK
jgi:apolipoprotein N-acyltransferase